MSYKTSIHELFGGAYYVANRAWLAFWRSASGREVKSHTSMCKMFAMIIAVTMLLLALTGAVLYLVVQIYYAVQVLLTSPGTPALLWGILTTVLTVVGAIGLLFGVAAFGDWILYRLRKKKMVRAPKPEPEQEGFIRAAFHGIKQQYCPMVDIKDMPDFTPPLGYIPRFGTWVWTVFWLLVLWGAIGFVDYIRATNTIAWTDECVLEARQETELVDNVVVLTLHCAEQGDQQLRLQLQPLAVAALKSEDVSNIACEQTELGTLSCTLPSEQE